LLARPKPSSSVERSQQNGQRENIAVREATFVGVIVWASAHEATLKQLVGVIVRGMRWLARE
jgi:hypothetical protein